MRNKKTIGIILLLIVLTAAVVFVPQLISERRETKRIDEVTYRNYYASERAVFTSEQVARLYYDRQIETNNNLRMVNNKSDDAELIRREVTGLLDQMFGKGTDLSDPFNTRIEQSESSLSCYRNSCLILVENHPMALNFVNCCIKENDFVFEIIYEEKTNTLLGFTVETVTIQFRNSEEREQYSTKVEKQMQELFEDGLGLGPEEYYCSVDLSETSEGQDGGCSANAVIRCGILKVDEKGEEKK